MLLAALYADKGRNFAPKEPPRKDVMNIIYTLIASTALMAAGIASYQAINPDILAVYNQAHEQVVKIESGSNVQLIRGAEMAYLLDGRGVNPTAQQLTDAGYLSADYIGRERVAPPLNLDTFNKIEAHAVATAEKPLEIAPGVTVVISETLAAVATVQD